MPSLTYQSLPVKWACPSCGGFNPSNETTTCQFCDEELDDFYKHALTAFGYQRCITFQLTHIDPREFTFFQGVTNKRKLWTDVLQGTQYIFANGLLRPEEHTEKTAHQLLTFIKTMVEFLDRHSIHGTYDEEQREGLANLIKMSQTPHDKVLSAVSQTAKLLKTMDHVVRALRSSAD